jgi:hypothetical protein
VVWNVVVENRGVWKVFIPGGLHTKVFKRNELLHLRCDEAIAGFYRGKSQEGGPFLASFLSTFLV